MMDANELPNFDSEGQQGAELDGHMFREPLGKFT